ncbi:hypothetical protein Patl1_37640 [Pistacia atlantica]|nr:hypothetical protein Patl1_37640 [Pistacia atlantica]
MELMLSLLFQMRSFIMEIGTASDGENEDDSEESREKILSQPLSREELYVTEDALVNFKSELAVLELEIQVYCLLCLQRN